MSPIAEVATNLLAQVRCLRPKRSHDAHHEVARLVYPLELDAVPDAAHILKVRDDVDFPLREEATAARWASRVVSGRSIDDRERIGSIVGRDAHRNELTAVVHAVAELDDRGMTPVMLLEQSARHLRRLRHYFDGVEQRERTDVEARRGRLLLALIPPLEDRAELFVVTNDDSVTGLAQRRHPLGEQHLRGLVDDDPVEQHLLRQVVPDGETRGCHNGVGAQEDIRLPLEALGWAEAARTLARESAEQGGIQRFA